MTLTDNQKSGCLIGIGFLLFFGITALMCVKSEQAKTDRVRVMIEASQKGIIILNAN